MRRRRKILSLKRRGQGDRRVEKTTSGEEDASRGAIQKRGKGSAFRTPKFQIQVPGSLKRRGELIEKKSTAWRTGAMKGARGKGCPRS